MIGKKNYSGAYDHEISEIWIYKEHILRAPREKKQQRQVTYEDQN